MNRTHREAVVDHLLGWERRYSPNPAIYAWERPDGERMSVAELVEMTDSDFVRMFEDVIEQRGLQEAYILALYNILTAGQLLRARVTSMGASEAWRILRATPEQRYQAALNIVGVTP